MDGRRLSHKTREELRIRAVNMVESGESPEDVVRTLGFHRSCIYEWLARYREGGVEGLRYRKIPGRKAKLGGGQIAKLYRLIAGRDPRQLKFEFALWTREMVREVIRREFGVRLSATSVGRLLRKMGLSPQKPMHRAYEQDPAGVRHWRESEYPRIASEAKAAGARIYFGDEASIRSDYHRGTTWAPQGETPVVRGSGQRFSINMLSAVEPRGNMRFMLTEERLSAPVFIDFLKRLLEDSARPVFLILDRHPVHRSKAVRRFVDSREGKLRLYFLPSYSPELNPDEQVWNYVKNHGAGRMRLKGKQELKKAVLKRLLSLQKFTSKIRGFFMRPHTLYAHSHVG